VDDLKKIDRYSISFGKIPVLDSLRKQGLSLA